MVSWTYRPAQGSPPHTLGCGWKKCNLYTKNKGRTISLDDFKNLWQIFEKLFFSMNDYDVVLSLLDNVNAHNDGNLHIIKINYL